jgi:hypothetical protein
MAKKASSSSKRAKRPVNQSSVKGGGIMSLNKSNTSPFMKVVIIVIIVAMVTLFFAGGIAGFMELFKPRPQAAKVDPVVALKAQFDPQITAITAALASEPASYTLLVTAGNKHFDYALELSKLSSAQSTTTVIAAAEQWAAARAAFEKAAKANKQAPSGVMVDYSITTYYSGDTTGAVKIASAVIKKDPTFAPAFYNIAIFYEGVGNNQLAIAAYQKYLALDPTGKFGNPDYAKQQLKTLGAPEKATGGSTPATGPAPTTP